MLIADEPEVPKGAKLFDPAKDGFNPLPLQYREARELAASVFPDKDLMTYRNGRRALTRLLLDHRGRHDSGDTTSLRMSTLTVAERNQRRLFDIVSEYVKRRNWSPLDHR